MKTATHSNETHHATEAAGVSALWSLRGGVAIVWMVREPASDKPGYRWPDEVQPDWPNGEVAFRPGAYPPLAEACERLPEFAELWNAIAAEVAAELATDPTPGSPAYDHAAFFGLPSDMKQPSAAVATPRA